MTRQEFEILVGILARAGVTPAEAQWVNALIERTRAQLAAQQVQEAANEQDD